eukprot:CAMPEP_0177543140 /NCGR_PEP_ID=MMETSP0369-20130122/61206_1 /TAXON_ID=447022 ORGANISM="Scrippsiella hangoei-like, Strain SHHI-4" /NCGR_SAMPLE_ID=MMETSP0369 /ASSEMBLY_ACC=CAM_ASM_000364 /LENGTH=109 /DNA_ID=CAMNT_0019026907 /DNA_START=12 /DNA_END=339 /DNA_ORIENTATION=-
MYMVPSGFGPEALTDATPRVPGRTALRSPRGLLAHDPDGDGRGRGGGGTDAEGAIWTGRAHQPWLRDPIAPGGMVAEATRNTAPAAPGDGDEATRSTTAGEAGAGDILP